MICTHENMGLLECPTCGNSREEILERKLFWETITTIKFDSPPKLKRYRSIDEPWEDHSCG